MRDLTDTLKNAQQAMVIDPLVKIVLTRAGQTTRTYDRTRILDINHPEQPFTQRAELVLDNSDKALTALDLKGFEAVISYGAIGSAGEEYSACAPLSVIAQRFNSSPGTLDCVLSLVGIPNLLALDRASRNYIPDENDTKTIETLLIEILGATLGCFSHCKAYEVVVDSRDSLINTYKPKDSFRIYKNNTRLAIVKRLLDCTKCVMLAKADGKLHIFVPTISGEVYDSEYSLESGHTFFSKAYRKALVIPNYIYASSPPPTVPNWVTVTSDPYSGEAKDQTDIDKFGERRHTIDYGAGTFGSNEECATEAQSVLDGYIALHDPYYEGIAYDQESIDAIGEIRAYWQATFESDAQAQLVAQARLSKYKLNAEMGGAAVPLNVGAEVYDYIKVTDEREDDYRIGTLGSLARHYKAEEAEWRMTFSLGQQPEAVDVMAAIEEDAPYFGRLIVDNLYVKNILADSLEMHWLDPEGNIDITKIWGPGETFSIDGLPDGEYYARVKTIHLTPEGGLKMDEFVTFDEGFDPRTKETAIHRGTTPPEDLTKLWIDTSTELNVVYRYNGVTAEWERASPANLDQLEDGLDYARVKTMALNPDGLVLIDEIYTVGGTFGLVKSMALTVDGFVAMDELVDGDYARVKSAALSAEGLVLLDRVEEGDYGLVKMTDISAGHIKLSATISDAYYRTVSDAEKGIWTAKPDNMDDIDMGVSWRKVLADQVTTYGYLNLNANTLKNGVWYNESGVRIDASSGIQIFGTNMAFTTRPYENGPVQCYVGSDGKIYAGAGAVILDSGGIRVVGDVAMLKVRYYEGTALGSMYAAFSNDFRLESAQRLTLLATTDLRLYGNNGIYLYNTIWLDDALIATGAYTNYLYDTLPYNTSSWIGTSTNKWAKGYFTDLPACPVPTSNSALAVIRKIKAPHIMNGKYGKRHYFKDEDFPDEMKIDIEEKDEKGKVVKVGGKEIEFVRTIGVLVEGMRELTDKVEALETNRSKSD